MYSEKVVKGGKLELCDSCTLKIQWIIPIKSVYGWLAILKFSQILKQF